MDLPSPIRERVEQAREYMQYADEMGRDAYGQGHHYDSVRAIANRLARDIHAALVAFLRRQDLPPRSQRMIEYAEAYRLVIADREEEFAPDIAESEAARESWLEQHPEVASDGGTRDERRS